MFVPNFIILCQVVPEKSLTEKKVYTHTHTHTHTHAHKHLHRKSKNYIPPIYFVYAGGINSYIPVFAEVLAEVLFDDFFLSDSPSSLLS